MKRVLKKLGIPGASKYCDVIPLVVTSPTVLFIFLPFLGQASFLMIIILAWGANSEANIAESKFGRKGVINGN
jgi:hypothetical protein